MSLLNNNTPPKQNRLFGISIIFIVCALIGATMLMMVATLLLAEWLGSLVAALAILGVFFSVMALLIYWLSVRPQLEMMRYEIAMISQIAHLVNRSYNWISAQLTTLLNQL